MWKNIVEPDRPQMTIWRMRFACWLPKTTNTLSEYVIVYYYYYYYYPRQEWLFERTSILRFT